MPNSQNSWEKRLRLDERIIIIKGRAEKRGPEKKKKLPMSDRVFNRERIETRSRKGRADYNREMFF